MSVLRPRALSHVLQDFLTFVNQMNKKQKLEQPHRESEMNRTCISKQPTKRSTVSFSLENGIYLVERVSSSSHQARSNLFTFLHNPDTWRGAGYPSVEFPSEKINK